MGWLLFAAVLVAFGPQLSRAFWWLCKTALEFLIVLALIGWILKLFE